MKLKITSTHQIAFDHFQINAESKEVSAVLNFSDKETFDKYATAKGIDIELKPLTRRKLEETETVVEPKVKKLKMPVDPPPAPPVVDPPAPSLNTPPKVVQE
jgi:hypothetical protein